MGVGEFRNSNNGVIIVINTFSLPGKPGQGHGQLGQMDDPSGRAVPGAVRVAPALMLDAHGGRGVPDGVLDVVQVPVGPGVAVADHSVGPVPDHPGHIK